MAKKPRKSTGARGGADSGLELEKEADRRLLRRAVKERWPIPMNKREKIAGKLAKIAAGEDKTADSRAMTSAARTLARMDQLNQADEHANRHYDRIDEGQATERVDTSIILIDDLRHAPSKPL